MRFFAELLEEYFQETARELGTTRRWFTIGGRRVAFEFAGDRWAGEFTASLAHLQAPSSSDLQKGLTVAVWDGSTPPRNHFLRAYLFTLTSWWFEYTGPRGDLLDIQTENLGATYHPDTGALSVLDADRRMAFYWKRDASALPYYEKCAPFRSLLHAYLRETGAQFVHGAGVGTAAGGALLVGKGGSGKSTSALACLASGLQYAGDDYCVVREDGSRGFEVHSLYCMAKVVALTDLDRFPALAPHVMNPVRAPGEKVAVSVLESQAHHLIGSFPLRAILAPVITSATDTTFSPCSMHEALMAIAPSTLSQLPSSGRRDLQFLGRMARQVPCYRLLLGSDIRQVPVKIQALLRSLGVETAGVEEARVSSGVAQ